MEKVSGLTIHLLVKNVLECGMCSVNMIWFGVRGERVILKVH